MRISQTFAGNYLKAADIPQPKVLTIETVFMAKMPEGDEKPVINFAGEQQSLVLNKTNGVILAELYGDETAAWHGRPVELYATTTNFGGKMVPCLRVRPPQQPTAPHPAPAPQPGPAQQLQQAAQAPVPEPAPAPEFPVDA